MGFSVKAGGAWKDGTPYVRVGGAWKAPDALYTRVGGVWKTVYLSSPVAFSATEYNIDAISIGATQVAIQFKTDGDIDKLQGGISNIGTWVTGTWTSSDYEVRLVKSSGSETLPTAWTDLSTSPFYTFTNTLSNTVSTWFGTAEIRDANTLTVLATAAVNMTAEYAP